MKWFVASVLLIWQIAGGAAQQQPPKPPEQRPQDQDPENYLRPSEPLPPLKLDYFVGKWTFEWEVPDSVFGPGGTIKGTEVYKPSADGKFIESDVEATGPAGAYKQHVITAYNEAGHVISRLEKDSRGFESLSIGRISTDQGFYLINLESSPFVYQGKPIRLRTVESLMGPAAYRLRVQMSSDGEPFRNLGSPWWRKDSLPIPPKKP